MPDIKYLTRAEMAARVGNSFDADMRARIFAGEPLRTPQGVFAVAASERVAPVPRAPEPTATPPAAAPTATEATDPGPEMKRAQELIAEIEAFKKLPPGKQVQELMLLDMAAADEPVKPESPTALMKATLADLDREKAEQQASKGRLVDLFASDLPASNPKGQ